MAEKSNPRNNPDPPDPHLEETRKLKNFLEYRLKGQPKAIEAVCDVYDGNLTLREIEPKKGPAGVFLFLGPSGVGKTEMARLLSQYLTGKENSLIEISCVGFNQPHMIHSIIGAPPSYIGFDKDPILSEASIKQRLGIKTAPRKDPVETAVRSEKRYLNQRIESRYIYLEGLLHSIESNIKFISFLENYGSFLTDPSTDKLKKINQNPKISDLTQKTIQQDSPPSLTNSIFIAELYAETRNMIRYYVQVSTENELDLERLGNLGQLMLANSSEEPEKETKTAKPDYLVILFDEIEKGNEALHNLLLEIMAEGKVTLANNTVTDLSNAFIILTGNIGAKLIGDTIRGRKFIGFNGSGNNATNPDRLKDQNLDNLEKKILHIAEQELDKFFSPEFRGRIDKTVIFRPLPAKSFYEILDYQIDLFDTVLRSSDVTLSVSEDVKNLIISRSLHRPEVGARLLNHKFSSLVKIPLARLLYRNQGFKGTAKVYVQNDKIKFSLQ